MSDCSTHAFDTEPTRMRQALGDKVYIIGPVTGLTDDNRPAFEEARRAIERHGFTVELPHDFIDAGETWTEAMKISIRQLTKADIVIELDGSDNSPGARIERDLAWSIQIPTYTLDRFLEQIERDDRERRETMRTKPHTTWT